MKTINRMSWKTLLQVTALAAATLVLPVAHGEAPAPASAADEAAASDARRAQALLARAVDTYRQQGDGVFAAFNGPSEFVDRELYVWVLGTDGVMLASGGSSAALIGRKVANMRDAFGTPFSTTCWKRPRAATPASSTIAG